MGVLKSDTMSREEIYFLSRENVEGYTTLLHYFWNSLSEVSNSCIVNINARYNNEAEGEELERNLLFPACATFASTLTTHCSKVLNGHIKSININVDLDTLERDEVKAKMCDRTFKFVGIKESVDIY